MRKGFGVLIIEVKDWNLDHYYCDGRGNFILRKNNTRIKSPFSQVNQYKDNLYNLHSSVLLEKGIFDSHIYGIVKCAVYFHNATVGQVNNFMQGCDFEVKSNIQNHFITMGRDSLNPINFNNILYKSYLSRNSRYFDDDK